mgnify:FL=1
MSAYGKYQNAYKRASVNTMDQNKLIVMLYDGAIKNITFGVEQMRLGNVEKTHTHLVKSKNIVAELMASLNMDKGGEVAKNLRSLYSYMFGQLIESNMSKNPEPALLVRKLLMELREAWVAIGKKSIGAQPPATTLQQSMGPQPGRAPRAAAALGGSPRQQPSNPAQAGERRINLRG